MTMAVNVLPQWENPQDTSCTRRNMYIHMKKLFLDLDEDISKKKIKDYRAQGRPDCLNVQKDNNDFKNYVVEHAWCSTTPVNACRLSAEIYMDLYIYIHIYTYACTHTHAYMHTPYICIHIHTHTHTYIHGYIYIHIRTYMNIYIYTYTYAYAHIYIYISTSIAYAHPVESVKQMCTLMFKTSVLSDSQNVELDGLFSDASSPRACFSTCSSSPSSHTPFNDEPLLTDTCAEAYRHSQSRLRRTQN